ncbi:MAG: Hsp33 family molecular chaperone HslO [Lachnospiraceae bacterium]|nr:Hsp33 family molecular chaperone HslO [Lachnospiraceae bacterium]
MADRDYIVRATAADEFIRAFAITSRGIAETARRAHDLTPVAMAALGRLLSATAMMGTMMKGDKDVLTVRIDASGPLKGLLATADSHGNVKGYVGNPNAEAPDRPDGHLGVGAAVGIGVMSVIKDLGLKEPYVGDIELQSGEIAEDFTYYFAASEQTPSSVGLGVLVDRDRSVLQSGGFIVQLMPDVPDEVITQLETNLKALPSVTEMLSAGLTPEGMLEKVLAGLQPEFTGECDATFSCNCSKERYTKGLASLGREDLLSLIHGDESVEVVCQFCGKKYEFTAEELKTIAEAAIKR